MPKRRLKSPTTNHSWPVHPICRPAVLHHLDEQHERQRERDGDGSYRYPSRDFGELIEERTNERHYQYERRQG